MQAVYTNKFKIFLLILVVDIIVNNLYIVMTLTNEDLKMIYKECGICDIKQLLDNDYKVWACPSNVKPSAYGGAFIVQINVYTQIESKKFIANFKKNYCNSITGKFIIYYTNKA